MSRENRPSPSVSAALHPNEEHRGNDGHAYQSVPDKNGVFRWRKLKATDTSGPKPNSRRKGKGKADDLSNAMFGAFYGNPVIHYSDKVMEKLPRTKLAHWKAFLVAKSRLEAEGVEVRLVPLALDAERGIWWQDYPMDYVERYCPIDDWNAPYLVVIIKVDDNGHYLQTTPIAIDHGSIQRSVKSTLMRIIGAHKWFRWSGKEASRMFIEF